MGFPDVTNGWLILWLEPLGEDRWLRPGDVGCGHQRPTSAFTG
ncbi:hypothetical protein [Actinoplanes couchii]|nr:hypothetical protein [Actinoplanes couchii]MDR6320304.1 hypothetical protein [Actinoplanes couchii]